MCYYAELCMLNVVKQIVVLLKVVMLNAIILSVIMLCVDRLNVVAPKKRLNHKGEERLGRRSLNFFVVIYYSVSVKLVCLTPRPCLMFEGTVEYLMTHVLWFV